MVLAHPALLSYSLLSEDFEKVRHVVSLVRPGLVYAADGERFARVLDAVDFGDAPIVVSEGRAPAGGATLGELLSLHPTLTKRSRQSVPIPSRRCCSRRGRRTCRRA